ncbi:MAG: CPBP family intramembrane metalloprotease [Phycisphaerae bacterium]|jgi:membrane protease YdiL (CAAX protease family)
MEDLTTTAIPDTTAHRLRCVLEALIPIAAAQAYIWLAPLDRSRWLDAACGVLIVVFMIVAIVRHGPRGRRSFGFGPLRDHSRAALPVLLITVVGVAFLLLYGWRTGQLRQNQDIWRALAAYPVWGLAQQFVMFGFIYPRLKQAAGARTATLLTAGLFALAHTPNPLLMVGGGLMVLGYALVWERAPSLPLLAISHGVIGAVADKALHVSLRVGPRFFEA